MAKYNIDGCTDANFSHVKYQKLLLPRERTIHVIFKQLLLKKEKDNCSVVLVCERGATNDWSIDLEWKISLQSTEGKTHSVSGRSEYNQHCLSHGAKNVMTWSELLSGFVVKKRVIVEAEILIHRMEEVEQPKKRIFGDEWAKKHSDVTLIVKDEKFFVEKQNLSSQLSYSFSLFDIDLEKPGMAEVELYDVEPRHFQRFLEVVYHEPTLTEETVEDVLQLAKKYRAADVTLACEKFLKFKSRVSRKIKLQLVVTYNLNSLKDWIFESFESEAAVRAAMDPKMEDLDILKRLLDVSLKFHSDNY
ncbi:hypothetical protein CAEBREN_16482 [Caenorhabditis brenneri]|uniref:BTB domain-containing protein n=1 Tax=Caenorhabditis brenneri TaxID=135651 RepID=G0NDB1_CAEBE|nr:hypothetical protein CAEBREN_16482 [Caenorhabditis brenneri]